MAFSACSLMFFFFNDTATTEIYTLSLHDALPISHTPATAVAAVARRGYRRRTAPPRAPPPAAPGDRKSTRLNSSHPSISYAVFCLKKKKQTSATWLSYMIDVSSPRNLDILWLDFV